MQTIQLFSVETGKKVQQISALGVNQRFGNGIYPIAFAPDGKAIARAGAEHEDKKTVALIQLLEVASGKEIQKLRVELGDFFAIAFAPDGKKLAGSDDGTVHVFDLETGKPVCRLGTQQALPGVYLNALVFSPDGKVLATRSSLDPTIQLWDVEARKELRRLGNPPEQPAGKPAVMPQAIAFSPDGKTLAEGLPSNLVRIWDVATGKEIQPGK